MAENIVPQSRVEEILIATINGNEYTAAPQSRLEYLLLELKDVIEEGGGGGGEENVIESISLNGVDVPPDANKNVALTVITNTVNNLVNYYLKTETYSKTEVDTIVAAVKNGRFIVVSELPTEDIDQTAIYLVPKSEAGTRNIKDEYINLDGTTSGWEKIGDTEIDLSGYVTDDDLIAILEDYVTATSLATTLASYVTSLEMTTALAGKQNVLTAGNYIAIENNAIRVNRTLENPIVPYTYRVHTTSTDGTYASVDIDKKDEDGVVLDSVHIWYYEHQGIANAVTMDDFIKIYYDNRWVCVLLDDSETHQTGYQQTWNWNQSVDFSEVYDMEVDLSGKKLVIKEEMDAALADKQDKEEGKGLSTNDYTTPEKNKLAGLEAYDGFAGQSICYFESNNPNVEIYITGAGTTIESALGSEDQSKNLYMIRFTADAPATLTGRLFEYDEEYPVATMNPDLPIIYFDGTPFTREIHAGDYIIIKLTGTNPLTGMIVADFDSTLTGLRSDVKLNTQDLTTPSRTKNLLPMTVDGIKAANTAGTWSGNAYTLNGITFTLQADNDGNITGIKANGTSTNANVTLYLIDNYTIKSGTYQLNGSIGGSSGTYRIYCQNGDSYYASYDGDSEQSMLIDDSNTVQAGVLIRQANVTVNDQMFYPMIRPAAITDPTFAPYIPSVESRIEAAESGISELNSNLTSKQDATDNSLQTTDKTVVGGINEVKSGLNEVNSNLTNYEVIASVTGDGVKTTSALLSELYSLIDGVKKYFILNDNNSYRMATKSGSHAMFERIGVYNGVTYINSIDITSTGATWKEIAIAADGTLTVTDKSSDVPTSGKKIQLVR